MLLQFPRMPATVTAERIEWPYSITPVKVKLRSIRPEYLGLDPADRLSFAPGEVGQLDLWQPDYEVPVGFGRQRKLWVLAMTLGYSRMTDTVVLPGRLGGDLMSGMWLMMARLGRVPRRLVWDRESAIASGGKPTALAATFFGTLGVSATIAPRKDPEFKGMIERSNRFFETSFLPDRCLERRCARATAGSPTNRLSHPTRTRVRPRPRKDASQRAKGRKGARTNERPDPLPGERSVTWQDSIFPVWI